GLGLVAARYEVPEGHDEERVDDRDGDREGYEPGVGQPAAPFREPPHKEDPGDGEDGEPAEPLPDMAPGDVAELVGGDGLELGLCEASVQDRVVEDHALRRPESRDVRVRGGRPLARVR